jgi:uncharacterized protein YbjT (DUF2867 family)
MACRATGRQGGSVVDALLRSGKWRVRGLSRNIESDQAKALASKGVEMVQCHVNNSEQLAGAFKVRLSTLTIQLF